jgi:hypothetical protein
MARKLSGGLVGQPSVGAINVEPSAVFTAPDNQDIGFGNNVLLSAQNDLRFADSDSSNYVAVQAPSSVATNYTITLPSAVAASNGFALVSDTNGNLSWSETGATLTDNTTDSGTNYIVFTTSTTGSLTAARVATTTRALSYQPSTGTLNTTLFNETSSITLKENFVPITDALDKILSLQGWLYDRKDGSQINEAGLIAEEVDKILPNLVSKDKNGNPSSISYTRLTAYLIEAVKSLNKEIKELKGA